MGVRVVRPIRPVPRGRDPQYRPVVADRLGGGGGGPTPVVRPEPAAVGQLVRGGVGVGVEAQVRALHLDEGTDHLAVLEGGRVDLLHGGVDERHDRRVTIAGDPPGGDVDPHLGERGGGGDLHAVEDADAQVGDDLELAVRPHREIDGGLLAHRHHRVALAVVEDVAVIVHSKGDGDLRAVARIHDAADVGLQPEVVVDAHQGVEPDAVVGQQRLQIEVALRLEVDDEDAEALPVRAHVRRGAEVDDRDRALVGLGREIHDVALEREAEAHRVAVDLLEADVLRTQGAVQLRQHDGPEATRHVAGRPLDHEDRGGHLVLLLLDAGVLQGRSLSPVRASARRKHLC